MSKNRVSSKQGTEQELWDYVSGNLSAGEAHAKEMEHVDDPFWNDAVDGLGEVENKEQLRKMQMQLQQQLRQQTQKRKQKRKGNFSQAAIIAILFVLLLLIIGYLVVQFATK